MPYMLRNAQGQIESVHRSPAAGTDLPDEAQAKLFARKSFRERISKSSLHLFEQPTDFGDVI